MKELEYMQIFARRMDDGHYKMERHIEMPKKVAIDLLHIVIHEIEEADQ